MRLNEIKIASVGDAAKHYANILGGSWQTASSRVWTRGDGKKYRDPKWYIHFKNEEAFEKAWDQLLTMGKRVFIKTGNDVQTYIKIGKIVFIRSRSTYGVFTNNPTTIFKIALQTTSIFKNNMYQIQDLTPQEAQKLIDIAATRNDNAMKGIKELIAFHKGKENLKVAIDQCMSILDKDKAVLNKIIDGAKDFKEIDDKI